MSRIFNRRQVALCLCCSAALWPVPTEAVPIHSSVTIGNVSITPVSGSLHWLTDWQLEAYGTAFDNVSGPVTGSDTQTGQPATATASASGAYASGYSSASVDGTGNILNLQAGADLDIPLGLPFAATAAGASAFRKFEVIDGCGPIRVEVAFDWEALFDNSGLPYANDYTVGFRIVGPSSTQSNSLGESWILRAMKEQGRGFFDIYVDLETIYEVEWYVEDSKRRVPDAGNTFCLALLALLPLLCGARGKVCVIASIPGSGSNEPRA